MSGRFERRWKSTAQEKNPPDPRSQGQRDRDRVLYTAQFRRLAEVTQVVGSQETDLFHNRLTHTLEVAQIARRIAERWVAGKEPVPIDPDVVEAAALAHDIGHPPFGHIAEEKLDQLLREELPDGFEGNAQSFRIVTKLARRSRDHPGLDLTRASLQAVTKYPWPRGTSGKEHRKYGTYHSEKSDFQWSREGLGMQEGSQTPEATIMDWSDDVAYALHDVDDFFRAGLIPLDRLAREKRERTRFLERTFRRWESQSKCLIGEQADYETAAGNLFAEFPNEPWQGYSGSPIMAIMVPYKINQYVRGITVSSGAVVEDENMRREIDLLKSLTWTYVIEAPALAAQQEGQRRVIETLLHYYTGCASSNKHALPIWAQSYLQDGELVKQHDTQGKAEIRVACDVVASLSERQALALYSRLSGQDSGSIMSTIVR